MVLVFKVLVNDEDNNNNNNNHYNNYNLIVR